MSDTPPVQIPPTPPVVINNNNGGDIRLPAQVINDPAQALSPQTDAPQRVSAEVVARTNDGAVRVRVEGDEVEIRPAPRPTPPAQAQQATPQTQATEAPQQPARVEVQISSAALGRQIEIEIPARLQAQVQQGASVRAEQVVVRLDAALVQAVQTQQTAQAQAPTRTNATPVQVTIEQAIQPQLTINPQTGLPAEGEIIRLLPLSSSQAANITPPQISITESANLLVNTSNLTLTPRARITALTNNIIAPDLQLNIANFAPTPSANNSPLFPSQSATPAVSAPTPQTPPDGILQSLPQFISAIPAVFATPETQSVLPQGLASLNVVQTQAVPIVTASLLPSLQATQITAQLNTTLPPQISLIVPNTFDAAPQTQQIGSDTAQPTRSEVRADIAPQNLRADRVSARLEGFTQTGQPVFAFDAAGLTPSGQPPSLFALDYALTDAARAALQTLPHGLRAEFSLTQPLTAQTSAQTATPLQASLGALSPLPVTMTSLLTPELWPAANTLYQNIAQASIGAANAFASVTPSPSAPAQFGPAVMFFVAAMRSGDISGWLGNKTIDALQRSGKGQSLSKFLSDGASMARLIDAPASNDWRAMSVPLMYGERIEKIALYYKREDGKGADDAENNKGGFHRFIFNLSPENMGKVQLDGLFRQNRLDLAVRTEQQFSQAMKMDMRQKYTHALEVAGVHGELSFQRTQEHWVTITPNEQAFGASA